MKLLILAFTLLISALSFADPGDPWKFNIGDTVLSCSADGELRFVDILDKKEIEHSSYFTQYSYRLQDDPENWYRGWELGKKFDKGETHYQTGTAVGDYLLSPLGDKSYKPVQIIGAGYCFGNGVVYLTSDNKWQYGWNSLHVDNYVISSDYKYLKNFGPYKNEEKVFCLNTKKEECKTPRSIQGFASRPGSYSIGFYAYKVKGIENWVHEYEVARDVTNIGVQNLKVGDRILKCSLFWGCTEPEQVVAIGLTKKYIKEDYAKYAVQYSHVYRTTNYQYKDFLDSFIDIGLIKIIDGHADAKFSIGDKVCKKPSIFLGEEKCSKIYTVTEIGISLPGNKYFSYKLDDLWTAELYITPAQ